MRLSSKWLTLAIIATLFSLLIFWRFGSHDSAETISAEMQKICSLNKESCYSREFQKLTKERGYEFGFSVLAELQKNDPDAIGCHLIAHGIGFGAYARDPEKWQSLILELPPGCNYGAIHGVMESHVASLPDGLTPEIIPTLCSAEPNTTRRGSCNHIVGHLLLVETEVDIDKALRLCDVFKNELFQQDRCYTGVFMEYETALNLVSHGLADRSWLNWPARLDELEKVCRSYNGLAAKACWQKITHVALVKFRNDPKTIYEFCDTAGIPEATRSCKNNALGIMVVSMRYDFEKTRTLCEVLRKNELELTEFCYTYLVLSALSNFPEAVDEAAGFCGSLEQEFRQPCFATIERYENGARID